jgi:hypothetical protein
VLLLVNIVVFAGGLGRLFELLLLFDGAVAIASSKNIPTPAIEKR